MRRHPLAAGLAVLFVPAVLLGFFFTMAPRTMLQWSFHALTGDDVRIVSLSHDGDATVLRGVSITAAKGDATIAVPEIRYGAHDGIVWLSHPSASVILGNDTLHRLKPLLRALALVGGKHATVAVVDGSVSSVRPADTTQTLDIESIDGIVSDAAGMQLRGDVIAGAVRYPFSVAGDRLQSDRLPAAQIWPMLPASSVALSAGFFDAVDVAVGRAPSGNLTLAHVRGSYDGHALRGLHGTVLIAADGVASRDLGGFADNIPIDVAGEAHDITDWNAALRGGTRDLRALARVYESISPTANLHWARIEAMAPGLSFGQYSMMLDGVPRVVQLVTIDPHERTLHFDTAISGDHLISKGERTSQMGMRTHAAAGLNGDYFDIAGTYEPQGMFMMGGKLFRGPTNRQALIVDRNNVPHFAEFRLRGALRYDGQSLRVTQYNNWPLGFVTVITPDFGHGLTPVPGMRFLSLQPLGRDRFRVIGVTHDVVPSPIHFGVAVGPELEKAVLPGIGGVVHLHYAIDPAVNGAVAGIGGGPLLLRDGKWFEDPDAPAPAERDVRWPVDALGVLADRTVIMVAVDGRHPERSGGMTRPEFGKLLQDLGVTDAMALDSGGSVTLVARAPGDPDVTVRNVPSDDSAERYVSNAIFVYSSAPPGTLLQKNVASQPTN